MLKKVVVELNKDLEDKYPTIAVCLATFNGSKYIYDQLFSIFKQSLLPSEVIISDDNSTDETINIIEQFKNDYDRNNLIKIVRNETQKRGHVYNFFNACENINSELVFFADQDDVWLPNKIEVMVKILLKYNLVALHSNEYYTDEKLNVKSYYNYMHKNLRFYDDRKFDDNHMYVFDIDYMLTNRFEPNGCCMLIDSKVLPFFNKYLAINEIIKPFGHDYIIFYLGGILGKCGFINIPLIYRRIHGDNVMGKAIDTNEIRTAAGHAFKRTHYLYEFIKDLNRILPIKHYKYYRVASYLGLHSIKWGFYCVWKAIKRYFTGEEGREVL